MSKHTPGPWRVEEDTTVIWGKCDPEDRTTWGMGYPIAQTRTAVNNPRNIGPDMDEALANARLIARAPEMAAEIERLTARVEELEGDLNIMRLQRDAKRFTDGTNPRAADTIAARVAELDLLLRNVYPVIDDGIYPLVKQAVRDAITKGEKND